VSVLAKVLAVVLVWVTAPGLVRALAQASEKETVLEMATVTLRHSLLP